MSFACYTDGFGSVMYASPKTSLLFQLGNRSMQNAMRVIPFCLGHQIALALVASVFCAGALCAQEMQRHRECEAMFATAVRAEYQNDLIEAELRYEECRDFAQRHRLPKLEAASLHRLAVIKARSKQFPESVALFRGALDLEPRNALILRDFAQLFVERKDYAEAEKLLRRALDADPDDQKTRSNLDNLASLIAMQRADRQAPTQQTPAQQVPARQSPEPSMAPGSPLPAPALIPEPVGPGLNGRAIVPLALNTSNTANTTVNTGNNADRLPSDASPRSVPPPSATAVFDPFAPIVSTPIDSPALIDSPAPPSSAPPVVSLVRPLPPQDAANGAHPAQPVTVRTIPAYPVSTPPSPPSASSPATTAAETARRNSSPEHKDSLATLGTGSTEAEMPKTGMTESGTHISIQPGSVTSFETAKTSEGPAPVRSSIRASNSPPAGDKSVPQSPSALLSRRGPLGNRGTASDSLSQENVYDYVAHLRSDGSSSAASSLESAETLPGNHPFVPINSPNVPQFPLTRSPSPAHTASAHTGKPVGSAQAVVALVDSAPTITESRIVESRNRNVEPQVTLIAKSSTAIIVPVEKKLAAAEQPLLSAPATTPVTAPITASVTTPVSTLVSAPVPTLISAPPILPPIIALQPMTSPHIASALSVSAASTAENDSPALPLAAALPEPPAELPVSTDSPADAPVGFASTRSREQSIEAPRPETAMDSAPGFARSRK